MKNMAPSASGPLTLLYDAACPVCSLEMDHLRERDVRHALDFVDIAAPGFEALPWGATLAEMNAQLHAVRPDGSLLIGVDALHAAYSAVGLGWLVAPTGWAPLRPAFGLAYRAFARHRQAISRMAAPLIDALRRHRAREAVARMYACSSGACRVVDRSGS
jgi:predicted DCC family thiol-disulfide oxidoreductase YuxK